MSYLDRVLENEAETVKIPNSVELNGSLKVAGVTIIPATQTVMNDVTASAAEINLLVQGVAAGYKIARGTITPVSESDTVVTGLATVVAAVASLKGAPTLTCMFVAADIGNQAGAPAAGSIYIKTYKPTATTDVTPTSSTTPWSAIDWIAIGT